MSGPSIPINLTASFREQARDAVLDYMLTGAKALFALPSWGVFIGGDFARGAVSTGPIMDLNSVAPVLQRLTETRVVPGPRGQEVSVTCDAVAVAFPCLTALHPRQPRIAVISAQKGEPPVLDAYRISLEPLQLGIFRVGPLVDVVPAVLVDLILWGVEYPKPPASSGLSVQ